MYISEDWANKSITGNFEYDLYFFMSHEARHIYQFVTINRVAKGKKVKEDIHTVKEWNNNTRLYTHDTGGESKINYKCQPLEVVADAFANFFVMKLYNLPPSFSKGPMDLVKNRLDEITKSHGMNICIEIQTNKKTKSQCNQEYQ